LPSKKKDVKLSYYFEKPPEEVFAALTKPKKIVSWFSKKAKFEPKVGGDFSLDWGNYRLKGKVKKFVKDKKLVLSWHDDFGKGKKYVTRAAFTLSKKGEGTILKVKHSGFKAGEDWDQLHEDVKTGWTYFLMNLKSVLSGGKDLRSEHDEN